MTRPRLQKKKSSVGFGDVEVIELAMVAGENHPSQIFKYSDTLGDSERDENDSYDAPPSRSQLQKKVDSAAITLDWEAQSRTRIDLETYEEQKKRKLRMGKKLKRMSRSVRKRILRNIGVETSDIESEDESRAEKRKRKKKKKRKKGEKKKRKNKFNPFSSNTLSPGTRANDRFAPGSSDLSIAKNDAAPRVPSRADNAPGVPRRRNSIEYGAPQPERTLTRTSTTEEELTSTDRPVEVPYSLDGSPIRVSQRSERSTSYSPPPPGKRKQRRSSIGQAFGVMVKQPVRLAKYTTKKVGKMVSNDRGSRFSDIEMEDLSTSGRSRTTYDAPPIPRPPVYKKSNMTETTQGYEPKNAATGRFIDESARTNASVDTFGNISVLTPPTYPSSPNPSSHRSALRSSMKATNSMPPKKVADEEFVSRNELPSAPSPNQLFPSVPFDDDDEELNNSAEITELRSRDFSTSIRSGSLDESYRSRRSTASRNSISSVTNAIGSLAKQPVRLVKFTSKKVRGSRSYTEEGLDSAPRRPPRPPPTPQIRKKSGVDIDVDTSPRRKSALRSVTTAIGSAAVFTAKQPYKLAKKAGRPFRKNKNRQDSIESNNLKNDTEDVADSSDRGYLEPIADLASRELSKEMSSEIRSKDTSLGQESEHRSIPPDVSLPSSKTEISRLGDNTVRNGSFRQSGSREDLNSLDFLEGSGSLRSQTPKTGASRLSDSSILSGRNSDRSQHSTLKLQIIPSRRISMTGEICLSHEPKDIASLGDSDELTTDMLIDERNRTENSDLLSVDTLESNPVTPRMDATRKSLDDGNGSKSDGFAVLMDGDRRSNSLRSSLSFDNSASGSQTHVLPSLGSSHPYSPRNCEPQLSTLSPRLTNLGLDRTELQVDKLVADEPTLVSHDLPLISASPSIESITSLNELASPAEKFVDTKERGNDLLMVDEIDQSGSMDDSGVVVDTNADWDILQDSGMILFDEKHEKSDVTASRQVLRVSSTTEKFGDTKQTSNDLPREDEINGVESGSQWMDVKAIEPVSVE